MLIQSGPDYDLAARFRPVIRYDSAEPYLPVAMGYTVMNAAGQSPSSKFALSRKAIA